MANLQFGRDEAHAFIDTKLTDELDKRNTALVVRTILHSLVDSFWNLLDDGSTGGGSGGSLSASALRALLEAGSGIAIDTHNGKVRIAASPGGGNITPGGPSMGTPTIYATGPSTAY